jgi:hypothetical protein
VRAYLLAIGLLLRDHRAAPRFTFSSVLPPGVGGFHTAAGDHRRGRCRGAQLARDHRRRGHGARRARHRPECRNQRRHHRIHAELRCRCERRQALFAIDDELEVATRSGSRRGWQLAQQRYERDARLIEDKSISQNQFDQSSSDLVRRRRNLRRSMRH